MWGNGIRHDFYKVPSSFEQSHYCHEARGEWSTIEEPLRDLHVNKSNSNNATINHPLCGYCGKDMSTIEPKDIKHKCDRCKVMVVYCKIQCKKLDKKYHDPICRKLTSTIGIEAIKGMTIKQIIEKVLTNQPQDDCLNNKPKQREKEGEMKVLEPVYLWFSLEQSRLYKDSAISWETTDGRTVIATFVTTNRYATPNFGNQLK